MARVTQTVKTKGKRYLIRPPGPKQVEYLRALGLTEKVFPDLCLKCIPIIPEKKEVEG